ncbi:hypothetical protein AYI70_g2552 [Smittium culicis]|uniref:Uncharacterized protein n=1 Tax=Smittium culicis TaxID=133412 RepID=A0A1R1Y7Q5_9FUNG|nr:hypothetical protein AYI70_g2552 [Smittium culicis]
MSVEKAFGVHRKWQAITIIESLKEEDGCRDGDSRQTSRSFDTWDSAKERWRSSAVRDVGQGQDGEYIDAFGGKDTEAGADNTRA